MKTSLQFGVTLAVLGAVLASMSAQTQSTTVQVSKLVGTRVKSSQGDELGVIKDVVIDRNSGCMAYTILSTSGGAAARGGGGKLVAVPWTVYSPSSDVSVLTTTVDRERIYNAPVFDYARIEEYSRPDYITNVYSYYGVTQGAGAGVGVSGSSTTTGVSGTSTTTGASSAATSGRSTAGSPPAGGTSPAATTAPAATRSPVERESPAGKRSPRPHATGSPHERGEANATPSSRNERRARPEETQSPSGGAELQREPSEASRESPSEATSSGERTREGNQTRPHRKPERREANTPPPDDGSGERR